jgi:hypothetical protein
LDQALGAFVVDELPQETALRWIVLASHTALLLWDHHSWQAICTQQLGLIRDAGALSMLRYALIAGIVAHIAVGELAQATSLVDELGIAAEATRNSPPPQCAIALAASQGREAETLGLVEANMPGLVKRGEGMGMTMAQRALGVLYNGLGRYKICRRNAIAHRLTKPSSPTTTGKIERFHQTLRRELLDDARRFTSVLQAQAALDGWVREYNAQRPDRRRCRHPRMKRRSRSTAPSTTAAWFPWPAARCSPPRSSAADPFVHIEPQTLMFLDPTTRELLRVRPNPLTGQQALRLQGARPAGAPPRPRTEPVTVQRRVSATGVITVCRQHVALGRAHAGRTVSVHVSEHTLAIELGDDTRTVRRTTSLAIRVIKGSRPHRPQPTELSASVVPEKS